MGPTQLHDRVPVWVDAWQYQCCGDDFSVGEMVRWTLVPGDRDLLASLLGNAYPDWEAELQVARRGEEPGFDSGLMAELRSDGLVVHVPEQELSPGRDRVTVGLLAEEHHGRVAEGAQPTAGIVRAIHLVHCRYAPLPGTKTLYPAPGTVRLTEVRSSTRWAEERRDEHYVGLLVWLEPAAN